MERRELEEIARFFAASGHRSPMAYLDLDEKASEEEIEVALKKKRRWAQGQQANPKYRAEALFVIKFNAALRRLLIEERETYEAHFLDGQTQAKLDEIDKFIRGALAVGVLTPQLDAAIRVHGRSLEMADHAVEQRINAIANELGITQSTDDDAGRAASTIDFYALLQVSPFANDNEIAEAYRERYRWARNLRDHDRSGKVLGALDDAWRILRDPERRKRYDQRRDELESVTAGVEKRARALAQLVEGSDGSTPPTADPARTNETTLAGIRARTTLPPGPDAPSEPLAVATSLAEGEASPEHSPLRLATTGEVRAPIPNISGRTLGLASGPQQLGERQPRLALPGKTIVRLVVPRSAPVSYPVKVQNAGQGEMPGKLVSDAIWLVVGRAWLDPQARQQDVMVEIRPADMPANRASATLTVVADHGERRVVSFEVSRRSYVLPFIAALTLTAGFASTYFAMQYRSSAVVDSVGPTLRLEIDPPADRVLVDDVLVGAGRTLEIAAPQPGRPFRVRIETDGFTTHEELVSLKGTSLDRRVTLVRADSLAWSPPAGEAATLLPEDAGAALRARADELGACFTDGSPRTVTLRFTLRVTADGQVRGLDFAGEDVDRQAARDCVSRVVRALRLEPFSGSWAQGEVPVELRVGQ